MKKRLNKQKGQVVLMVMLASALILTLGLSASRKATVETKIDTDQELLKKAFNAAESGIEYYLGTGSTLYGSADSTDGLANLSLKSLGDVQKLSFGYVTLPGGVDYFWLVNHNDNGDVGSTYYSASDSTINICDSDAGTGSFKIDYFYKTGTTISKSTVVSPTDSTGCVKDFNLATGNSMLITVSPIGFSPKIEIQGTVNFPVQGEEISSTGTINGVNNTVTVINKFDIPTFLLEAVTSEGNVSN
jgi:hypothetical protein